MKNYSRNPKFYLTSALILGATLPIFAAKLSTPREFQTKRSVNQNQISFESVNRSAQIHVKAYKRVPNTHFKDALALSDHDTEQGKRLLNAKIDPAQRVSYAGLRGFQFALEWTLQNQTTKLEEIVLEEKDRLVAFTFLANENGYRQFYATFINTVKSYRPGSVPTFNPTETVEPVIPVNPGQTVPVTGEVLTTLKTGTPQVTYLRSQPLNLDLKVEETGTYFVRATNFGQVTPDLVLYDTYGKFKASSKNQNVKQPGLYVQLVRNVNYRLIVSSGTIADHNRQIGLELKKFDPAKDISIIYAHYGNTAGYKDVTNLIKSRRSSNYRSIRVKNAYMGGDPVDGGKYLSILLNTPLGRYEKRVNEGGYLYFSELNDTSKMTPSKRFVRSEITIKQARYGSIHRSKDVTERVKAVFDSGQGYILARNREFGGDPHSGASKKLTIEISTPYGVFSAETAENTALAFDTLYNPDKLKAVNAINVIAPIYKPFLPNQIQDKLIIKKAAETKTKEIVEKAPEEKKVEKKANKEQEKSVQDILDIFF